MFEEIFADLDTSLHAEGVKPIKCDPNRHIWFWDGEYVELSTDVARMKNSIERLEGKDGREMPGFFARGASAQRAQRHTRPKNELDVVVEYGAAVVLALHPFESIHTRAARYFLTERLRRLVTFGSMYMGTSPFGALGRIHCCNIRSWLSAYSWRLLFHNCPLGLISSVGIRREAFIESLRIWLRWETFRCRISFICMSH